MKNVHSMPHAHTKLWMRSSVAFGLSRPITNQIATPERAPKTTVASTKKRLTLRTNARPSSSCLRRARPSATTRYRPPPMAKCDTKTWSTAITAIRGP